MTTQSIAPVLRADVSWTDWGDGHLLFNPSNRSTLRLESVDHDWIVSMDRSVSLQDLEVLVSDPNHLLQTLEQSVSLAVLLLTAMNSSHFSFPISSATHGLHQSVSGSLGHCCRKRTFTDSNQECICSSWFSHYSSLWWSLSFYSMEVLHSLIILGLLEAIGYWGH